MDRSTNKLLQGTVIYFIGNALTHLMSLVLLRFVTGHVSPDEYGAYNLVVMISNIVTPLITLQMADAVFKFLIKSNTADEKKTYITITFVISFFSSIAIALGVFAIHMLITPLPHPILTALYMIATNLYVLYQRIVRSMGKNTIYVQGNLIKTFFFLILQIVFIYCFDLGGEILFLSTIISEAFFLVFAEIRVRALKMMNLKCFSWSVLKVMLKFSVPLIPNAAFWWLTSSVNSLIVSARLGLDINGIYTVSNKFSSVLTMVTSVFIMSWQESAIKEYGNKEFKSFFTKTFSMYFKIVFSAISVLIPFMFLVFPFMVDASYSAAIQYAPFLLVVSGLSTISGFFAQIFVGQGKTYRSLWTTVVGMIVNMLVIFTFVDKIGLWAAVFGSMGADATMLLLRMYLVRNEFDRGVGLVKIFITIAVLISSIVLYFNAGAIINGVWLALVTLMAIALNFGLIKDILSIVFGRFKKTKQEIKE